MFAVHRYKGFRPTGYGSEDKNKFTPEELRAIPNQGLIRVFGIENASTTSDKGHRLAFKV